MFFCKKSILAGHIGVICIGTVAHADDLILTSALCVKQQAMPLICEEFGMSCELKFNFIRLCVGCVGRSGPELGVQFSLEIRDLQCVC